MIRVALFLVIVGLIALGITWIADRPGEVSVTWLGWRIETSLLVLLGAVLLLVAFCIFVWSLLRGIFRSPRRMTSAWRGRREAQGHRAITRGLIAVGAGDGQAARRYAEETKKLVSHEPLALLLTAQSAQLNGDRAGAERAFRDMAAHEPTKLLGLRGLFIEAQRRDDIASARLYAEEAARSAPSLPWAGQAVLQIRCATGDWAGALDILERNRKTGALDRATYRRHRAVLLTARALALEESERDTSKALVLEAVKLAPDLVPAAALAGRFLAEGGELRKASRLMERAWQADPHPDLAETYAYLRFGDSARDRLTRVRKLAAFAPNNIESALALARAAIDAREFAEARRVITPFLAQPTQRVALLMADLEQAEFSDEGRSREWTARAVHAARDPVWTADGFVSERWMPMSPVSGRIDAFEWKAALAEIADHRNGPDVEPELPPARPIIEVKRSAEPLRSPEMPAAAAPVGSQAARKPVSDFRPVAETRIARSRPVKVPEAIIPIAHVPDDPGPDAEQEPEPSSTSSGRKGLFFW